MNRILLLTLCAVSAALGAAGTAQAREHDGGGHARAEQRRSHDRYSVDLTLGDEVLDADWHYDRNGLRNLNDGWGYRAFIPQGGGGRIYYGDGYGDTWGGGYGDSCNSGAYYGGQRPYEIRRYGYQPYSDGLSLSYRSGDLSFSYRRGGQRGRHIYSAPDCDSYGYRGGSTYYYGDGPIVIDGRGRDYDFRDQYQQRGGDYYDNRSYDNSETNNYYYDSAPAEPQRYYDGPDAPALPQRGGERTEPAPDTQRQPGSPAFGTRFYEKTKLASDDGGWRLSIVEGKLYAANGGSSAQVIASKVDDGFGAYAMWSGEHGLRVVYRRGGDVYAAWQQPSGEWWSEALPYNVDFSRDSSLGLMGQDLWFTFTGTDHLRYVVALSGQSWVELGSASGVR